MIKNVLLLAVLLITLSFSYSQTVTIGTQVWMTKNLDVDKFRNGDPIQQVKTSEEWEKANINKQPAWCYYDNDPLNGTKYGKLYNWYAVHDQRGLAPIGFHIPTIDEWTKLINYLGGESIAGKKIKNTSGWNSFTTGGGTKTCANCSSWSAEYRSKVPCHICKDTRSVLAEPVVTKSGNGSNSSKFTGLPGGNGGGRTFYSKGNQGWWWTSSENINFAWTIMLDYKTDEIISNEYGSKGSGMSVRCLKD
jgi:uncharacterized protein (TIGR02145 family)